MKTWKSCAWCHRLVNVTHDPAPSCPYCGHRADLARLSCDCSRCQASAFASAVLRTADEYAEPRPERPEGGAV